ncbi:MAG: Molecular chaperone [Hymenobacter sp.]|nr:Molecular chaperone [Hymenobacter sp.]
MSTTVKNEALPQADVKPCTVKRLSDHQQQDAVHAAVAINPLNASLVKPVPSNGSPHPVPMMAIMQIGKRWDAQHRTFTVSFQGDKRRDLQDRIISHMNAWNKTCGITFKHAGSGIGQVRISFGPGGYWSYVGTDIMLVDKHEPTMNLEGFSMDISEDEYKRVVRHETGHTLGFEHEHMRKELVSRIDPKEAYTYFWNNQGWDRATVDAQVLTPLDQTSTMGTPPDDTSIMCYQLPGEIMKDGVGIPGGKDINPTDYAFAGRMYPKTAAKAATPPGTRGIAQPAAMAGPAGPGVNGQHFSMDLLDEFNQATLI